MSNVVFDEILGKVRAGDVNSGGGGGGGSDLIAGNGLTIAGGTASVAPGYRLNTSGGTVNQDRFFPVETVSGTSVTLQAGHAYIINATTSAGITLICESFAANTFGLEGHATIYTANAGYVQQGANVFLADPLEPDAVNNCTIRFHGGSATVSVEDYFGGYIVLSGGTGSGSLPYGLASAGSQYIGFNASLNGQTLDMGGSTANGEKHIVGNGYTSTILTGAVNCGSSSFTVANLSLQNVQVTGGVMTLGDAYIPSGSTVAVSGGGLAVEKVTGAGSASVIDLGGTNFTVSSGSTMYASGTVFTGGHVTYGGACANLNGNVDFALCVISGNGRNTTEPTAGAFYSNIVGTEVRLTGCTVTDNKGINVGGYSIDSGTLILSNSIISGNSAKYHKDIGMGSAQVFLDGGNTIGNMAMYAGGTAHILGENTIDIIYQNGAGGTVIISSGAILDLTGNTNSTPIAPGGGVTFEEGGATVKVGDATASSSYMMDNVTLPGAIVSSGVVVASGAKLTNTNVIDLGGTNVVISSGTTASASGCTFSGGDNASNGIIYCDRANVTLSGCTFTSNFPKLGTVQNYTGICSMTGCQITGNLAVDGGVAGYYHRGGTSYLNGCIVSGNVNSANSAFDIRCNTGNLYLTDTRIGREIMSGGTTHLMGACGADMIEKYSDSLYGSVILAPGAILDLTGNTNATPIAPGGGITFEAGGAAVKYGEVGSMSSMFIDNVTISAIGNAGNVTLQGVVSASEGGATFVGAKIDNNIAIYRGNFATFSNCIASGYFIIGTGQYSVSGSAYLGGAVTLVAHPIEDAYTGGTRTSLLDLAPNTTVTLGGNFNLCTGVATVVVSSGVTVNGNTVTPGTYHNCTIDKDGNITEA